MSSHNGMTGLMFFVIHNNTDESSHAGLCDGIFQVSYVRQSCTVTYDSKESMLKFLLKLEKGATSSYKMLW
jgi:hypothetical protein